MNFITITILLQAGLYLLAFGYSQLVLRGKLFKKIAIQKKDYRQDVFSRRFPLIALNMFLVMALSFGGFYLLRDFFIMGELSPWGLALMQIGIIILIDDAYFYFFHRTLHTNKYLLRVIHKRHHAASKPFPLDYMYVHPFEWMGGMMGVFLGLAAVFAIYGGMYASSFWIYICIRNFHEMHIHSGLQSHIVKHLGFIGTADHHDLHHSKLIGNYGSTLKIWDKVFGTEFKGKT